MGAASKSCYGRRFWCAACHPQCRFACARRSDDAGALPTAHRCTVVGCNRLDRREKEQLDRRRIIVHPAMPRGHARSSRSLLRVVRHRKNVWNHFPSPLRRGQGVRAEPSGAQGGAEQGRGADCFQCPLLRRSRFQQQLTPGVDMIDIANGYAERTYKSEQSLCQSSLFSDLHAGQIIGSRRRNTSDGQSRKEYGHEKHHNPDSLGASADRNALP